jgi:CRP-like cAMP-binding protein
MESNHVLQSLSRQDLDSLRPSLAKVTLERGETLAEDRRRLTCAHLPTDAILSVITVMKDGRMVESRTIGRESGYGLLHALGSRHCYERVEVQVAGEAWKVPLDALAELAHGSPAALKVIAMHAQATVVQSAVSVACNMLHGVHPRLCRWLLMTQDRLQSDVLPLTQEHLGIMLGVQRTTVTAVIAALQESGAVRTLRGKITVLDRAKLEACACECYEAIDASARRLSAG